MASNSLATMTTTTGTATAQELKKIKNSVIGNPLAKARLAKDEQFMRMLVDSIEGSPSSLSDDVRIEAAHIVASLAYGSKSSLSSLLRFNLPHALILAISNFTPVDSLVLKAAFARSLRALISTIADVVGPSEYGLRPETSSIVRLETKDALNYIFQLGTLDTLLPLLLSPSPQLATPIVQLIASATRSAHHRSILTSWLPPDERLKEQGKARKRGWEKISSPISPSSPGGSIAAGGPAGIGGVSSTNASPGSSWVVRVLISLLARTRDVKLQEAVVLAVAALAKENVNVAVGLARGSWYQPDVVGPPLALIQTLSKSRNLDVQLAACLCSTHIVRACNTATAVNNYTYAHSVYSQIPLDDSCVRAVLNMVNRVVVEGSGEPVEKRVKACYILYHLTTDDKALCQLAFEKGCMDALAGVVKGTTPVDPVEGWDENEAEGTARLREASLTAIATLALFSDQIRRAVTDVHGLLPYIETALRQGTTGISSPQNSSSSTTPTKSTPGVGRRPGISPGVATVRSSSNVNSGLSGGSPSLRSATTTTRHWNAAGVRYAGCQCVRVLARAVSVLRTNIVDSGLGMEVFRIVVRGASGMESVGVGEAERRMGEGGEDRDRMDDDRDEEDDGVWRGGEDRRVLNAALAAVCNIVMEFSPLRPIYLEQGLMPRLVQILCSGDVALRLNALWAIKNLLWKTSTETKRDVMSQLGWERLLDLLHDGDLAIQEQAYQIIRNLAESEEGITMVFAQMGGDAVLDSITEAISLDLIPSTPISPMSPASPSLPLAGSSTSPTTTTSSTIPPIQATSPSFPVPTLQDRTPTIIQAMHALANICNAPAHLLVLVLDKPQLLLNLKTCLAECGSDVRRGAVGCVLALAKGHARGRKALVEVGVVGTLRRLCEWVPPAAGAGTSLSANNSLNSASGMGGGGGESNTRSSSLYHPEHHHHHHHHGGGGGGGRPSRSPLRTMSVSGPLSITLNGVGVGGSAVPWTSSGGAVGGGGGGTGSSGSAGAGGPGTIGRSPSSWYGPYRSGQGGVAAAAAAAADANPAAPTDLLSSYVAMYDPYMTSLDDPHPGAMLLPPMVSATTLAAAAAVGLPPPSPEMMMGVGMLPPMQTGFQVPSIANLFGASGSATTSAAAIANASTNASSSSTSASTTTSALASGTTPSSTSDPSLLNAMGFVSAEQQRQYREYQIYRRMYMQQQQVQMHHQQMHHQQRQLELAAAAQAQAQMGMMQASSSSSGPSLSLSGEPPYDAYGGAGWGVSGVSTVTTAPVGRGGGGGGVNNPALDVDKEVYENARRALDWLEHGDGYGYA